MVFPARVAAALFLASQAAAQGPRGYYRQPALHANTVVFAAEGDLWKAPLSGGVASRLTSHPGDEGTPRISPDGKLVAFTAQYEGPTDVFVMPISGGLPKRLTWDASRAAVVGWKGDRIIASTTRFATLPSTQLSLINPETGRRELLPLAQASDGVFDDAGKTLFFTRLQLQGSHTKRYKGGTTQNLWKFEEGAAEAVPLTADFAGASAAPMWWKGRLYHTTDRDGTMELWSMLPTGKDLKQHTRHDGAAEAGLDVKGPALADGRIVYQLGADLWVYDITQNTQARIDISLDSDFDQTRENWVEKPMDYVSDAHLSPDGDRVVLTARGQVFVAPRTQGRLVEASRLGGVRYRDARFMPDGKSLLTISDESGETEFWTLPPNGVGGSEARVQLSNDGAILRWEGVPSPDGKWIAHHDKNQKLWLLNLESKVQRQLDENRIDNFASLAWSADSTWLAYVTNAENLNRIVKLHNVATGQVVPVTTDRFDTFNVNWSRDGKWLYLLSDRNLHSVVGSPWGAMAPEPFFDKKTKIYLIALKPGHRSPFLPTDELQPKEKKKDKPQKDDKKDDEKKDGDAADDNGSGAKNGPEEDKPKPPEPVEVIPDGVVSRLVEVPVPAGNYSDISADEKRIFWISRDAAPDSKPNLMVLEITNKDPEAKVLAKDITGYELSADGKAILIKRRDALFIIDASASAPVTLDDKVAVKLSGWTFPITPREEWRQMFTEAWRLERDYFYDQNMHGVDWKAMLNRYMPMVDRVSTRAELSDLIAQMVGELSTLHIFVRGGDLRQSPDQITPACLGAFLERDEAAGGFRIASMYESDPDYPELRSPLAVPGVDVKQGDVIVEINGRPALSVPDPSILLRNQAGKQVLLRIHPSEGEDRNVIVLPISPQADADLRYHHWQFTRRQQVEAVGKGDIGYVHLRAMGNDNFTEFARGFYPVFTRKGLIIDVRNNRGGNIDSWLLSRLLRKAWFFWQPRVGDPYWNMQYAFRGHVAVLCNEQTASDGEAFSEGVKRLKIGTVIGTRTWGGEVWLSSSNFLVDGGIATAAEIGVFGPEGEWLIEGHGVEPDIVVDNLPHATFNGKDAQLEAAIQHLQKRIVEEPVEPPPVPPHPNKAFRDGPGRNGK